MSAAPCALIEEVIDEKQLDVEVDEAMAPYRRVLPAHVRERMRQALRLALLTHPDIAPLTRAVLQRKDVEASGEAGPDIDRAAAEAKSKKPAAGDGG